MVTATPDITDALEAELLDQGLEASDIAYLKEVSLEFDWRQAPVELLTEELDGFGRLKAQALRRAVDAQLLRDTVVESDAPRRTEPLYLKAPEQFDNRDPDQWTRLGERDGMAIGERFVPIYRKRVVEEDDGTTSIEETFDHWERRRSCAVIHHDVDGYLVPDPNQRELAQAMNLDYFDRGLRAWILAARKHSIDPTPEENRRHRDKGTELLRRLVQADDF